MRNKLARFMIGRNGVDALGKCFLWVALGCLLLTYLTRQPFVYLLAMAALGYSYFRMMSKNTTKRYYENQKFLTFFAGLGEIGPKIRNKIKYQKSKAVYQQQQRKIYKIFRCPGCKQKLRAPRGKGKLCITCSKCQLEFIKRT